MVLAASTGDLRQSPRPCQVLKHHGNFKSSIFGSFSFAFCLFSPLVAFFLTYVCNQAESPGYSGDSGSRCCDSGLLVSTTAVGPDGVMLRDMSSRKGEIVQEINQRI